MISYIIIAALVLIIAVFVIWLNNVNRKVYMQFDDIYKKAINAKDINELENIMVTLKEFSKQCWHQDQFEYADKIKQYIRGRIDGYNK
jgi:hypothetical protein